MGGCFKTRIAFNRLRRVGIHEEFVLYSVPLIRCVPREERGISLLRDARNAVVWNGTFRGHLLCSWTQMLSIGVCRWRHFDVLSVSNQVMIW